MKERKLEIRDIPVFASKLTSDQGEDYYRFDYWFKRVNEELILVYFDELPEDLQRAITKARMGGRNERIMKPEELCG